MLEILKLYVSSFWAWAGITIGLVYVSVIIGAAISAAVKAWRRG